MSERKVLNKYYPPDFDPSKIPRLRLPKNRQYTVRIMAPCNMRCNTCGDYIAKAKKFNARKETVEEEEYLGLKVFRFYIKCPRCMAEITFKTDPRAQDYVVEHGATQNFMAMKLAEEQAAREAAEKEEEMKLNPMMMLENRTKQSQREMAAIEELEELREINQRQVAIDFGKLIDQKKPDAEEERKRREEEEDEEFIRSVFHKKKEDDSSDSDDDPDNLPKFGIKFLPSTKSTDMLSTSKASDAKNSSSTQSFVSQPSNESSNSSTTSLKRKIGNLVRVVNKKPATESSNVSHRENGSSDVVSKTEPSNSSSPISSSTSRTDAPPPPKNSLLSLCAYDDSDEESD